jgi:hypothetical protein
MKFKLWLEDEDKPMAQGLFPWMTEEDPVDSKKMSRYKSRDSYVKAMMKGGKHTEITAEKIVSASPNSFWSGQEELVNLWNNAFAQPERIFPNGQKRPKMYTAYALLKSKKPLNEKTGDYRYRLLAFYQGHEGEKISKEDVMSGYASVLGGIVYTGGYLIDAWVDKHWRGNIPGEAANSLYTALRTFARMHLGIHGVAPDDDLTSKSYRASQAKYDYNRYLQSKQEL